MKSELLILACLALAGCGSFAPNSDTPSGPYLGLEQRPVIADVSTVKIVEAGPPPIGRGVMVSGTSCMNKLWQHEPSRENAIALMKQQAAKEGLSAIYFVKVENGSVSLVSNCWASITASGMAYADRPVTSTLDQGLRKQTAENNEKIHQVMSIYYRPLVECVKLHASSSELYSSPESADVVARAAVGLCLREESAYDSALSQLALDIPIDANDQVRSAHQELLDLAVTIIVAARQRLHEPSSAPTTQPKQQAI